MHETPWVRSVYLYLMCVVSIALVALGAVGFVVGAVHTIAPDLGHRDTLDRVGIGLANIASDVVDLVGETEGGAEELCRDLTDNDDDFEDCVNDQGSGGEEVDAIQEGIEDVRSELRGQIRNNAIDHMIRGLLMIGVGVLIFRLHGPRTELYADGLNPPPAPAPPSAPPEPYVAPAPERIPPPPGAPPAV